MNDILYWKFDMQKLKVSAVEMRSQIGMEFELKKLSDADIFREWCSDYCVDAIKMAETILKKRFMVPLLRLVPEQVSILVLLQKMMKLRKFMLLNIQARP